MEFTEELYLATLNLFVSKFIKYPFYFRGHNICQVILVFLSTSVGIFSVYVIK